MVAERGAVGGPLQVECAGLEGARRELGVVPGRKGDGRTDAEDEAAGEQRPNATGDASTLPGFGLVGVSCTSDASGFAAWSSIGVQPFVGWLARYPSAEALRQRLTLRSP